MALTQAGSSPVSRTPQISRHAQVQRLAGHGHRDLEAADADRQHAQRPGRAGVAVGADQRLRRGRRSAACGRGARRRCRAWSTTGRTRAGRAQEQVVVGVALVGLQQVVVDVLHATPRCGPGPGPALPAPASPGCRWRPGSASGRCAARSPRPAVISPSTRCDVDQLPGQGPSRHQRPPPRSSSQQAYPQTRPRNSVRYAAAEGRNAVISGELTLIERMRVRAAVSGVGLHPRHQRRVRHADPVRWSPSGPIEAAFRGPRARQGVGEALTVFRLATSSTLSTSASAAVGSLAPSAPATPSTARSSPQPVSTAAPARPAGVIVSRPTVVVSRSVRRA